MDSNASIFSLPRPLLWQIYLLAWICGSFSAVWPLPSLLCFFLLLLAGKSLWKAPSLLLAIALFISASLLINSQFSQTDPANMELPSWAVGDGPYRGNFCGEIIKAQGMPNRRVRLILDKIHPETGKEEASLPLLCSLMREDINPFFSPMPGQTVCFKGSIRKIRPNLNLETDLKKPGQRIQGLLWQAYSNQRDNHFSITGEASPLAILREKLRQDFLRVLGFSDAETLPDKEWQSSPVQARAILLALCFGDRRLLSYRTSDDFAAATLAHSLALSGQHLGIVGLLAAALLFLLGRWRPRFFLYLPSIRLFFLLVLPLAFFYLWIGNAPPSLLRAAGMLFLAGYFIWRGSTFTGLDLLCGAILFFLLLKPLLIFDLGLQLSAICVLIIILFAPFIARVGKSLPSLSNPRLDKFLRASCEIILISLLIQIFLLPQNLLHFSIAGFYFPLNLIWLPLLGFLVLPFAFLALLISLFPGGILPASFCASVAAYPCLWLLKLLEKLRSWHMLEERAFIRPHWLYIVIFAILAVSLAWLLANRKKAHVRRLAAAFLILASFLMFVPPFLRLESQFGHKLIVEILDVGQGLSVYLHSPGKLRLLYDGGGSAASHFDVGKNIVAPIISDNSAPSLDAVINSHPDMDHLGGLFYILENFKIGQLFHNGHEARGASKERWASLTEGEKAHALYAGDVILLDGEKNGLRLEVLHPPAMRGDDDSLVPDEEWQGNHASLVMRLCKDDEGLLLLTGDAEKDSLKHLLASGQNLQARVLLAPHHGSDRSLLRDFYRKVDPELVVAGCAFQNRWNYPGKKLRKFLEEEDIPILDTGRKGKISLEFEEDGKLSIHSMDAAHQSAVDKLLTWVKKTLIPDSGDKKRLPDH